MALEVEGRVGCGLGTHGRADHAGRRQHEREAGRNRVHDGGDQRAVRPRGGGPFGDLAEHRRQIDAATGNLTQQRSAPFDLVRHHLHIAQARDLAPQPTDRQLGGGHDGTLLIVFFGTS